jgi:hypothetical protein
MAEQRRMRPVAGFVALAFCVGLGGLVACSSNNETAGMNDGAPTEGDAAITCDGDPRAEAFTPNLTKKGENGALSFVIAGSFYAGETATAGKDEPPAVANNEWVLKVLDATGQPVTDALVTFPPQPPNASNPWMPDHTHGALPAKAVNNKDGTYTISPLYFFMGGIWSTYINAQAGSVTDHATFTVCVDS